MKRIINWEKKGLIIAPQKNLWWMQTHAMVPTLEHLGNGLVRVYFSGRDKNNVSHIGWAIIDLNCPNTALEFSSEPVLLPGKLGCFDDNGVTPSCVVKHGERIYLYYIGWNPGFNVRMHLFGGLAISEDGGKTFERYSNAPILERCKVNPFLNTAPFVVRDDGIWRIYYVAGTGWEHKDLPRYHIEYATSTDGLIWDRQGKVAIDYKNNREVALARPWVLKEEDRYRMWFSYKQDVPIGGAYTIGYAESHDGENWTRLDEMANIHRSDSGWDSEMIEYGAVIKHKGRHFMFYNGNNYGAEGIGLAVEAG